MATDTCENSAHGLSEADGTNGHAQEQHGRNMPQLGPWIAGLLCVVCTRCTDGGALQRKLADAGYLTNEEVGTAFLGCGQISTWVGLIGVLFLQRWPRGMGFIGGLCSLVSGLMFAVMPLPASATYGLVALSFSAVGAELLYSAALSFSNLVPARQGLLDGIMMGSCNLGGLLFLPILNSRISVHAYYLGVAGLAILCCLLSALFFPNVGYEKGDLAEITKPSLRAFRHQPSESTQGFTYHLSAYKDPRFVGFVLATAWCITATNWVGGAMFQAHGDSAPPGFFEWGQSISGNLSMLSSLIIGLAIDLTVPRCGWTGIGFFMLITTALALLAVTTYVDALLWLSLLNSPFCGSAIWCTYYTYIQRNYPAEGMTSHLVSTQLLRAVMGFLDYPVFATNPWGDNFTPLVVFFIVPLAPLCLWPVLEASLRDRPRAAGENAEKLLLGGESSVRVQDESEHGSERLVRG